MSEKTEIKTQIDEEIHDDFIALARLLGFKNKSEYLRFIVTREVKGTYPQLQSNAPKFHVVGQG